MDSLVLFLLISVTMLLARVESSTQVSTPTAVPLLTAPAVVTSSVASVTGTATITEPTEASDVEGSTATGTINPVVATLLAALIAASASIITVFLTSWFSLRQADVALRARVAENTLNLRLQAYADLAAAMRQLHSATAQANGIAYRAAINSPESFEMYKRLSEAATRYSDSWMRSRMYLTPPMDNIAGSCYLKAAERWLRLGTAEGLWLGEEIIGLEPMTFQYMIDLTKMMTEYVNSVAPHSVSKLPQVAPEEGE